MRFEYIEEVSPFAEEETAKMQRALGVSRRDLGDLKSSNGSSVSPELLFAPLIEKTMQKLRNRLQPKAAIRWTRRAPSWLSRAEAPADQPSGATRVSSG